MSTSWPGHVRRPSRERPLAGQAALVTGASRGIGAEAANLLAAAGADLVLSARTRTDLDQTARRVSRHDTKVLPIPADIADHRQVNNLVHRTLDRLGGIDLVVNFAAELGPVGRNVDEVSESEWQAVLGTNLSGPFHLLRAVLPGMRETGRGRVLMISSTAADVPWVRAAPYAASRAGLDQLVRVAAAEVADSGIDLLTVLPQPSDTPTYHRVVSALGPAMTGRRVHRSGRPPVEAATLVLWLCGPAGAGMNGRRIDAADPWIRRRVAVFQSRVGRWLDEVSDG